jgi:hypothetical protein
MATRPNQRLRAQVRAALAGAALAVVAPGAMAATITVDSASDTSASDSCTLRDAITSANDNTATGGCMAGDVANDTIVFGDGVAGATITLTEGELPAITGPLTIGMDKMSGATIDADMQSRILTNQSTLTLNGLTLINGMVEGSGEDDDNTRSGGAILNDTGGVLTVNGGAMNDNTADRAGGAIEEASDAAAATTAVTLNGVDFSGNDAGMNPGNGGVLHVTGVADVMIDGGTFDSNTAREGGALWNNAGTMTVSQAIFTANTATGGDTDDPDQGGGAVYANTADGVLDISASTFEGNSANGDISSGGAIFVNEGATLTLSNSTLSNNMANRAGGAIELRNGSTATLDQVSAVSNTANTTATDGGGNGGAVHVTGAARVDVTGGVYARNTAVEGGAFWNNQGEMTFNGVSIVGNEATGADATQGGGGIYAETNANGDSGTLTINNSRISGNMASGAAGPGGGILVSPNATANITASRIFGNSANRAGGGIENAGASVNLTNVTLGGSIADAGNDAGANPGNGGGLHIGGTGTATITRSSVGHNTATEGGGLWNNTASSMIVNTSTVSSNTADRGAGIYLNGDGSTAQLDFASITNNNGIGIESGTAVTGGVVNTMGSSLVANNTSDDIGPNVAVNDPDAVVTGSVTVGGYRLFGGPTATQPLTADSMAALDNNAECGDVEDDDLDQRGATRPFDFNDDEDDGGNCDSGAFELTDDPVLTVTANGPESVVVSGDQAPSVLGFTLTNKDDAAVTVAGFSGYIDRGTATGEDGELPPGVDLAGAQLTVYLDTNANGVLDSGENPAGTGSVDDNGATFEVSFDSGGASVPANDEMSYVVTADEAAPAPTVALTAIGTLMPVYAGGALLGLVGLLSIGGVRRRTQLFLVVAAMTLMLTACNDDDGNVDLGGVDNGNPAPMTMGQLQLVMQQLNASGTDDLVIGENLPISGPALTFEVDSDAAASD